MSKIIPFSTLAHQQHLNFLRHHSKGYQEREDYLARSRQLLFKIEAQMRQAELQQLDTFREVARHFQLSLNFPDLGDRLALQEFFATDPFLLTLQAFFAGRLTPEQCYQKIKELRHLPTPDPEED